MRDCEANRARESRDRHTSIRRNPRHREPFVNAEDTFGQQTLAGPLPKAVIPAQAGIQFAQDAQEVRWMPGCAGRTLAGAFGQQTLTGAAC